ncbi:EAL domain-containing protein [Vibrio renipiscarius]|uniref:Signal peptide protein n=1 Tax=Vibrio renipiscarius TaxID=1461322 RepID=A0A0C2NJI4_9VIBR|nr:EAL domain-containing protein [Vibrio renipiscarius]KII79641.1 signal peptide protein [Vibrio renipiscarius]KII80731.1 signal peptide protein [Vibrio renipiscarius]
MQILIVEDDIIQATKLKLSLMGLGYHQVILARDAQSALEVCQRQDIEFCICDINLPDMDGVQFLTTLSNYSTNVGIAIHSAMRDDVIELTSNMCIAAGFKFVDTISKPHSGAALSHMFERFNSRTAYSTEDASHITLTVQDVNDAFEHNWFANYYQPQFSAHTQRIIGVEALVRCLHPRFGVLTPISFLETIQQADMSDRLFWHVAEKAIAAVALLQCDISLSINVTQSNFENDMCDQLLALCQCYEFDPKRLVLELTEHEAYRYSRNSLANLARLRMHGICLSIDDFGTGHASLSQLAILPFTELKIDRSFIKDVTTNFRNQQLTSMCIQLANSLGLHCIVEGIEDEATLQYLNGLGIDSYQGFYACKPLPIAALWEYVAHNIELEKTLPHQQPMHNAVILSPNTASSHAISKAMAKDALFGHIFNVKSINQVIDNDNIQQVGLLVIDIDFIDTDINELLLNLNTTNFVGSVCLLEGNNPVNEFTSNHSYHCFKANKNPRYIETIASTLIERDKTDIQKIYQLLSTQEINVANLLLKGFNNKKVATTLDISEKTVSTYKNRIFKKLDIQSIVELAQFR